MSTAVLALTAIAFFRIALLPEFGRDLSMSTFQLGMLTTTFGIGRLAADLPGGHLADRIRARRLMAVSAGGVALGSLILGLSVVPLGAYVAAFVLGISSATTNATGMTFFSNVGGDGHRGTSMAVFSAALLGGQAVGPAVGGLLSSASGWRLTMFVATAAALAVAAVLLVTQSNQPSPSAASPGHLSPTASREGTTPVSLAVLYSVSFAVFLTLGAVPQTLVPLIGADDLGLGTAAIGLALGVGRPRPFRRDVPGRMAVRQDLPESSVGTRPHRAGSRGRAPRPRAQPGRVAERHRHHVFGELRGACGRHDPR